MPAALSRFGTLAEFGSTAPLEFLACWPIVELASSINLPLTVTPRENEGTERDAPSPGLGIRQFH